MSFRRRGCRRIVIAAIVQTYGQSPVVAVVLIAHACVPCLNKAIAKSLCLERRQIEAPGVPNRSSASENGARDKLAGLLCHTMSTVMSNPRISSAIDSSCDQKVGVLARTKSLVTVALRSIRPHSRLKPKRNVSTSHFIMFQKEQTNYVHIGNILDVARTVSDLSGTRAIHRQFKLRKKSYLVPY